MPPDRPLFDDQGKGTASAGQRKLGNRSPRGGEAAVLFRRGQPGPFVQKIYHEPPARKKKRRKKKKKTGKSSRKMVQNSPRGSACWPSSAWPVGNLIHPSQNKVNGRLSDEKCQAASRTFTSFQSEKAGTNSRVFPRKPKWRF